MLRQAKNLIDLLSRAGRWIARFESSARFQGSLVLADFLLTGAVILVLDGFWLGRHLDLPTLGLLGAGVVLFHLACFSYADRDPPRWPWLALKITAANLLAWWILPY